MARHFNSNINGWSEGVPAMAVSDQFPAGLRVLVVDDDTSCLKILEKMLRRLMYQVTICSQANVALAILREKKGCFDLVLSDVHMPGMDGYKLLEHVGLEMDLPVIMMSSDGRTSAVMMGINHGACDYLIKPIRLEELKNIWQHVVRKKWNENKDFQHSGTLEDNDQYKSRNDGPESTLSVNEVSKHQRKRSIAGEDEEDDTENGDLDPSTSKKPRVVWSVELHQQFVSAVNQLGIDKAVPKRILELMNVPGLTRENVASHLQKFRLYLKRLSGMSPKGTVSNILCSNVQPTIKVGTLERCDIQTLAASGQIHPQTLAALFGRPVGNIVSSTDQPSLLQHRCLPVEHVVAYGHPVVKCPSSHVSKHLQHHVVSAEGLLSGFGVWLSHDNQGNGVKKLNPRDDNLPLHALQQKCQQQQNQQLPEPNCPINVQPSCRVLPSPSSSGIGTTSSPASVNQNIGLPNVAMSNLSVLSPHSNNSSSHFVQLAEMDPKTVRIISRYPAQEPLSPCNSACSVNVDNNVTKVQIPKNSMISTTSRQSPGAAPNLRVQVSYSAEKPMEVINPTPREDLGFVYRGNAFPSRFAIDEFESSTNNMNHGKRLGGQRIKQELDFDSMDSIPTVSTALQQFPSNDFTSVFTKIGN